MISLDLSILGIKTFERTAMGCSAGVLKVNAAANRSTTENGNDCSIPLSSEKKQIILESWEQIEPHQIVVGRKLFKR